MRSTNFRSQGKFVKRFCSSENLKMQHITITWWQGRSCLRPRSGISLLGVCADTLHGKFSTAERTEGVVVTASSHCASGPDQAHLYTLQPIALRSGHIHIEIQAQLAIPPKRGQHEKAIRFNDSTFGSDTWGSGSRP